MHPPMILVVDDTPANIKLLEAVLIPAGYAVVAATSGSEALNAIVERPIDLVLLDILMPVMDGYEVCRRIRAEPKASALPVVMVTSSGDQEKIRALEAGADDFVPKPFDKAELLARVKSLLRVKQYHDTVQAQAAELASWNRSLEARVEEQVGEIQRLARLRRFLTPQLADLVVSGGDEALLKSHRREIASLFCDLSGFTPFSEAAEPEEVMLVLRQFHELLGELINGLEATVGGFEGDGVMVFFNDPVPCADPALRAVKMALAIREAMEGPIATWRRRGYELGLGVGISFGYATLGEIGFEGRYDYGAIGSVVNLASRLCDETTAGQIIISQPAYAAVEDWVEADRLPDFTLKGISKPVPAYSVIGLLETAGASTLPGGLSRREAEILRLVAAGRSSREIGDELVLSVRTVERHVTNIYTKIGAHSRAQAAAWAIGQGLGGT